MKNHADRNVMKRNVCVGDYVLIKYSTKSKAEDFRKEMVTKVEVDEDGLVRTVVVIYKLINKPTPKYEGITTKEIRLPVQRLVVIMAVEDQIEREQTA